MVINGINICQVREWPNDTSKKFITSEKMLSNFKNVTSRSKIPVTDTISIGSVRPSKFSDAENEVIFESDKKYDIDCFKPTGDQLGKKILPSVRFRIKDRSGKLHWLGDFYTDNNSLIVPQAFGYEDCSEYYKKVVSYLKTNNLLKIIKNSDEGNVPIDFSVSIPLDIYVEGACMKLEDHWVYDDFNDTCSFNQDIVDLFQKHNIVISNINNTDNNCVAQGGVDKIFVSSKKTSCVEEMTNSLENLFKERNEIDFRICRHPSKISIDKFQKYPLRFTDELILVIKYFLVGNIKRSNTFGNNCRIGFSRFSRNSKREIDLPSVLFSNKRIARITIEIFSSIVSRYFNEKDITINSNHRFAHKDEFVSQLGISKDDAKYYTEFGKNIDSLEKTISKTTFSKNWIDGKTELEFFRNKLISVSFNSSDKFTREVRGDIVEYISLVNDAWNINQSIKKNIKVKFYGFRKSKGDVVSGITSSSYETVPPENTDKFKDTCKTIYIGLPYSIRATNSSVSSEIKNAINARLDQEVR